MKFKTTSAEVKEGYYYIISVGYCDLQYLLKYENPVAYAKGIYGWKFDLYQLDGNVALVTGYQPVSAKNTKKDYSIIRKYDELAKNMTREELKALLEKFVKEMLIVK
jgi:hypothetical protein